jgi:hypothetical protein
MVNKIIYIKLFHRMDMVPQTSGEDKPRDVSIENKLNNLIVPITVRRLPYTEVNELQEWENNALRVLEQIFGKDSSSYNDLYGAIQSGPPRYGQDPRGQEISPEQYQQEMDERLKRYQDILERSKKYIQDEPISEGKKIIDDIHNHLQKSNLFDGKDLPAIPYILTGLEREMDNAKGQWSGIEILKVIKDHMRQIATTDGVIMALDVLAEHWLRGTPDENSKITKQIVNNIESIDRNNIHVKWDQEIILNILRTIADITKSNTLNKEIEKIEKLFNRSI